MAEIRPGRYRHFKGNEYEVLFTARHSETGEEMVVYRALYGDGGLWVRPAAMWDEILERDGKTVRRFTYIGEATAADTGDMAAEEPAAPDVPAAPEEPAASPEEKKRRLYLSQKALLDSFLERNAISLAQYNKSLGDLTEKMGLKTEDL